MGKDEQIRQLENAIESAIQTMEDTEYCFPKRLTKRDYMGIGIVVLVCLAGVIAGAFI